MDEARERNACDRAAHFCNLENAKIALEWHARETSGEDPKILSRT